MARIRHFFFWATIAIFFYFFVQVKDGKSMDNLSSESQPSRLMRLKIPQK